jgi:pyruvate ferredoxin oxidoreductase gamma subunit
VVAFCRLDDRPIRLREPIMAPDALIIQDPTLLHQADLFGGLVPDGYVLINTTRSFEELGLSEFLARFRRERLCTVPATELALKHVGRAVPNAALLAGFAAVSGRISLASVNAAIRERFPARIADANVAAAAEAHEFVTQEMREAAHAQAD